MRFVLAILLLGVLSSGSAGASSFVALKRVDVSPSIIYFGEPDAVEAAAEPQQEPPAQIPAMAALPKEAPIVISPSIVALGEPAVSIEFSQVASINKERPRAPGVAPMVIRGGIFGDPFVRAGQGPAPGAQAPQQATSTPRGAQPQAPQPERPEPEPVLPPPAAPTGRPE